LVRAIVGPNRAETRQEKERQGIVQDEVKDRRQDGEEVWGKEGKEIRQEPAG
jgi:hypothetical protein